MYSRIYMHIYTYTQIKKVIEMKNEVKRNFLGRNDGVTLRTDSWT